MKWKNIAVLMTALDSDAQTETLRGIEEYGKQQGFNVSVFLWFTGVSEKDKQNLGELNIAYLPDFNLFDGVIVLANAFHTEGNKERIEELLEESDCPIVTVGCDVPGSVSVFTDSYTAMRELMEHYVKDHHFTRIHFVKGVEGNPDAEARYKAYVDVLSEYGIPVSPERVTQGDFYVTGGELAVDEILASKVEFPEAIVCANDTMAITVCDLLIEKGYRVPEDVAVAGYDYTTEGQEHVPAMTTVRNSVYGLGAKACEVLVNEIAGKETYGVENNKIFLPDEVVLNESCGCHGGGEKPERHRKSYSTIEVVQRKLIQQMIILEKNIMECNGIIGWLECLQSFVSHIDPPEFYWCVNEDFVETIFELDVMEQEDMSLDEKLAYTEKVKVLIAYKNSVFRQKAAFDSVLALDVLFEDTDKPKLYIFSPLHYLERNFGYLVFVDSSFPMGNPLYVSWLIKMGDSIENIRKQSLLRNAMTRLDEMYVRDSLTGAYNRFGMERFFGEIKKKCMMTRSMMQISFIDLDGLKRINDEYGHEEGDRIINAAATVLQAKAGKFRVVRYGGDEFIVLGTVKNAKEVEAYWKNVEQEIYTYNKTTKNKAELSLSYGYEVFKVSAETHLADCIRITDNKMYNNKKRKRCER
ncbi:MAG: diguanylate cyclase [Lachnospiraceae bacterium]|nr:diguanylate cyclase [Lachnospiraceae bacterium]